MAAKAKAPKKKAHRHHHKKVPGAKSKPKGLHYSRAQVLRYNKAFNATATLLRRQAANRAFAKRYQHSHLAAANASMRKAGIARRNAQIGAVAAHATSMSLRQAQLGHQNATLIHRIGLDAERHTTMLGRLQSAQAGTRAYARKAVMRTVTDAQAATHEATLVRHFHRTAKKARKSVKPKHKPKKKLHHHKESALSKSIRRSAQQAGRRAAGAPTSKKASGLRLSRGVTRKKARGHKGGGGAGGGRASGPGRQKAVGQAAKGRAGNAAQSPKAPVKNAKGRAAPMFPLGMGPGWGMQMAEYLLYPKIPTSWIGDEVTPNCTITAVANHLLHMTGTRVGPGELLELTSSCGVSEPPSIEEVLWQVYLTGWPNNGRVRLRTYSQVKGTGAEQEQGGLVIGFESEYGPHAALSLADGQIVSWGSVIKRPAPVEEAWVLTWER